MTATTSSSSEVNDKAKRIRREWLFPRLSINDVRMFIDKIATDGSGEKMRRINLLIFAKCLKRIYPRKDNRVTILWSDCRQLRS